MSCFEICMIVINGLAILLLLGTLRVYYLQLQSLQSELNQGKEQMEVMRDSASASSVLEVARLLQVEDIQKAREIIADTEDSLKDNDSTYWATTQRRAAQKVCGSYDLLGMVIRHKIVPRTPFIQNWGQSIIYHYNLLQSFVEQKRKRISPEYWDDLVWLYEEVRTSAGKIKRLQSNV